MGYHLVREFSADSLLMATDQGKGLIFERLEFPVMPRESLRLELQKGIKEVIQRETMLEATGLLKYFGLEKYEGQFYLVRDADVANEETPIELTPFRAVTPEQTVGALQQVLKIIQTYHRQGLILNGCSLGQLKQDGCGGIYLQDPQVINSLRKSLNEDYRVDAPPEVIRGNPWDARSDIFSWGKLAYQLLTGEDPFRAATPEQRLDKILRLGVIPPKDIKPQLGKELSQLVNDCLNSDPRKRPSLDDLLLELAGMVEQGALTVEEGEARDYLKKAQVSRSRYQKKERFWFWFRKYGIAAIVTLGALGFIILSWIGSQSKPVITEKNSPDQVLAFYFKGIQTLDVTLVDQTLHKVKNSFSDMVTNLYVINKTQQGMTYSTKDNSKLEFLNLKIEPLKKVHRHFEYKASYTLKITLAKQIQYIERLDHFTLQPIRKVWRITKIDVLQERRWTEPITTQNGSQPKKNQPASTLKSSAP
jgi:serine/threonine protein kinase